MSKILLGVLLMLVAASCGKSPPSPDTSLEKTPWRVPEKQIELLGSSDFRLRAMAATNLGNMGIRAKAAIPELEKLLKDENPRVQSAAEGALEKIRTELGEPN